MIKMIGSMKRILAFVLIMAIAMAFIPAGGFEKAYAEEGTIDLNIDENGVLSWEPVTGATAYRVYVGIDILEVLYEKTETDLHQLMTEYMYDAGIYDIRIQAIDNSNSSLAEGVLKYDFVPAEKPEPESGILQNVVIDENGIISWDPVPGVESYNVSFDQYVGETVYGNSADLEALIAKNIEAGYLVDKDSYLVGVESNNDLKRYYWNGVYDRTAGETKNLVLRIYGNTRYETSLEVAEAYREMLGKEKFDSVILAYGKNYADALAGSYLSAAASAPILLVDSAQSHIDAVQSFIREYLKDGGNIYILGGTAVVPDSTVAGLSGYNIERLGGDDRYETDLKILRKGMEIAGTPAEITVCSGTGFADSLSAAASGTPILLVRGAKLTESQTKFLDDLYKNGGSRIVIVGGKGAVSVDIEKALRKYYFPYRVGGSDRYETSMLYAIYRYPFAKRAVLAYGGNFPDGLCGGSMAYAMEGPLLLAANGRTAKAAAYVKDLRHISVGAVLGGPLLISDASALAIFDISEE